jgi:16S rRNA processing protein RimM
VEVSILNPAEEINIGLILGPFGVKGELKIMPLIDDANRLSELEDVLIGKENQDSERYEITRVRVHKTLVIIKLKGISSREDSMFLKNAYLRIPRDQLKELGEDQFYIMDLQGIEVSTTKGIKLGTLAEVIETPANDIYLIQGDDRKYLIPAVKDIIKHVDIDNKKMEIEPIEGLLDLEG